MPPDAEELLSLQRRLHRAARRATRAGGRVTPLPRARVDVLRALDRLGPSTPSELADDLGLARPTVSNLLRSLSSAGLVARARTPADGRVSLVSPTPEATAILERWRAEQRVVFGAAFRALSEADRASLSAALAAMAALCEELDRVGGSVSG